MPVFLIGFYNQAVHEPLQASRGADAYVAKLSNILKMF